MKVSYNWLKDYCEFDLPAHELAKRLSNAGLNVDTYEPRGADYVLDVEVTTNRPDCLCHLGLAREIAALVAGTTHRPDAEPQVDAGRAFGDVASIEVLAPDLCPHYTARLINGVKVGPSPRWMQDRLITCGLRPVSNVVDITNYVMLECGQPLHAFDLSLLGGAHICVRRAAPGEVITTIDGHAHGLTGEDCVIADRSKPVAIGGVMGGIESEIRDTTTDVLLESARFDQRSIRRTSRRHGLASDSAYRYERGVDPETTEWASRRAAALILELTGGRLASGLGDLRFDSTETPTVTLRLARLKHVLGLEVPASTVVAIFRGLDLELVDRADDAMTVRAPSWRPDLRREIDLIEEVARLYGYEKVVETTNMPVRAVSLSTPEKAGRRARSLLTGAGFCEAMTHSLVADGPLQRRQPWHDGALLQLRNPMSAERTHLRLTQMANLLAAKRLNQSHGVPNVDLFELSYVYVPRGADEQPEEKLCLALLTDRPNGLRTLKGLLANLMADLGVDAHLEERIQCAGPFRKGEALVFAADGTVVGCAGVASDEVVEELDLRAAPALMEVDFDWLVGHCRLERPYRPLPLFPATRRDMNVVLGEDVLWSDVERLIRSNAPDVLESFELFDIYRGEPVPEGHKSVAVSLTFRRTDRTITAAEAEEARASVLDVLEKELGAVLRGGDE